MTELIARIGDVVASIWHASTTPVDAPRAEVVLASGLVALVVVALEVLWRRARLVVTLAHEGGHALAAIATGRRLSGIRLHSDTSGLTVSSGSSRGLGMIVTSFAGYVSPALLGIGAAWLLRAGYPTAVLWILVLLLVGLLPRLRGGFGVWSVTILGAMLIAVSWWGNAGTRTFIAYAIAWFLLFGALRAVVELGARRRRGEARNSDADQLARITWLPGFAWVALFLLFDAGSLLLGAWWMLERVTGTLPSTVWGEFISSW